MIKIIIVFILMQFFVFSGKNVWGAEEFSTKYNLNYQVQPTGTTYVDQEIEIINKEKDVIATTYSLIVKQIEIFDVETSNEEDEISVTKENGDTIVKLEFKDFAIGQYKSKTLNIKYKTNDVSAKVGEVWNINIPKIQNLESVDEYNIKLQIPKSFGNKIYLTPSPLNTNEDNEKTEYFFNKEQLTNVGIDGAFGQQQILNFKLDYILENQGYFTKKVQIAIPPSINNQQRVVYSDIKPKPASVIIDEDGNYLAQYILNAKSTLNVQALGNVEILGRQIKPEQGGKFSEIPKNLTDAYTSEQAYWEISNPKIIELANQFKDENLTVSQNAYKIYDYITSNLEYDFDLVKKDFIDRKGAAIALTQKNKWACMEFTDSFIAIARAMKIPAREINGYAFSGENDNKPISIGFKSGDVLHAWPEFYDPKFGWVAIDPTWGATSGLDYFTRTDTSHFVFVKKGLNSIYPLPAGAYKIEGTEKQVEVTPSLIKLQEPAQNLKAFNTILQNPFKLAQGQKAYYVKNLGGETVNIENVQIPPFATTKIYSKSLQIQPENSNEYILGTTAKAFIFYLTTFVGALVLCGILFLSIIHSKDLKKLPRHLHRRLRGPNR